VNTEREVLWPVGALGLRLTGVNVWGRNSNILITRDGLRIMSLWGCGEGVGGGSSWGSGCWESEAWDRSDRVLLQELPTPSPTKIR
jgi:hypothetical protein